MTSKQGTDQGDTAEIERILDRLDRWYAGIDEDADDYLDPQMAEIAINHLLLKAKIEAVAYIENRTVVGRDSPDDREPFREVVPLMTIMQYRAELQSQLKEAEG